MRSINKNTFTRLILRHKLTPLKKIFKKKQKKRLYTAYASSTYRHGQPFKAIS